MLYGCYTIDIFADKLTLNDGRQEIKIYGKETFVYNLGTIYFVDKVLFTETSDVLKAMEKVQEKLQAVQFDDAETDEKVGEFDEVEEDFDTDDDDAVPEDVKEEEEAPRGTRKDASKEKDEEVRQASGALITFPDGFGDDYEVEEKVIFINNQKISILKQKVPTAEDES